MIIWITGISGAGKSTIANALMGLYKKNIPNLVNVDGDTIRGLFSSDLKYDEISRIEQIKRIQKLCIFLDRQGLVVIVSALYSNSELLDWNRKNFKNYFEIYLEASINLVKKRDVKGLYKKFDDGSEKNIVGLDIHWNSPKNYDLKINMDKVKTVNKVIEKISSKIDFFDLT